MRKLLFGTYLGEPHLTDDDRCLIAPLEQLGLSVERLCWERDGLPADAVGLVLRSCWNYHEKTEAFLGWLDTLVARGMPCCNSVPQVRWNLHKRYLLDLASRGVAVPPTVLLPTGDTASVAALLARLATREAVVKPAISMLAHDTYRLSADRAAESEILLSRARRRGDVLVQSFVPEIQTQGETSLIFFDGEYSHAVRKRPTAGDFRSQMDHGGTREAASPSASIRHQAERILTQLDECPCIARVDGVEVGNQLVLMELELIDPSLFLENQPEAALRCASALAARFA